MDKRWAKSQRKIIGWAVGSVVFVVVAGFIIWFSMAAKPEPAPLQQAQNMLTVPYQDVGFAIVLNPAIAATKGIVLYPDARIDSAAYAYKMSGVAKLGVAVVIVKPLLHLPSLDIHGPADFESLATSVKDWYVAGHSLGGVKACQVAYNNQTSFKGLILLGSYCAGSIATLSIPVLSLAGSNDGLTTTQSIQNHKSSLPKDTNFQIITGLNHAGFGNYGAQNGDGNMAIDDTDALQKITDSSAKFIGISSN